MNYHRKMRMGMVGGGQDAFIGAVHRMAAALDGEVELVCGAFSGDAARSQAFGQKLYLPPGRAYPDFETMIIAEKALPEGERMDFVSVVTPNHVHFAPAKMALEHGFAVVCDKPLALTLDQARQLAALVEQTRLPFCVTYNYTGYPMVKEMRDLVRGGQLGQVRKVVVEYPQGWLATLLEATGQKQAGWRTDPARSGAAGCMGDIGTHAMNMVEYVTGLRVTELFADLTTYVPGRRLDDDGNLLLHFDNGAKGILSASQIAVGEENGFNLRVYGETGGLWWKQEEPNTVLRTALDQPKRLLRTGSGAISQASQGNTRIPAGHPEGYVEAFANVYRNFAQYLRAHLRGEQPDLTRADFPTVHDGVQGMAFIETVLAANQAQRWTKWMG